jgi:hypothetical protein
MKRLTSGVLAVGFLMAAAAVSAAESLQVRDAWIREAPANAKALGAFATIHNPSATSRTLVAARSAAAEKLELHKTIMEGELAKMVAQDAVEVPANGEVKLQPGGLHIMLIGPKHALKAGDKVEITLEFNDGVTMPVNFEVRRADGMMMKNMSSGGMDHSMHHH